MTSETSKPKMSISDEAILYATMTPEEFFLDNNDGSYESDIERQEYIIKKHKEDLLRPPALRCFYSKSTQKMIKEVDRKRVADAKKDLKALKSQTVQEYYENRHRFYIRQAIRDKNPVSSEAIEKYKMELPAGYEKRDNLYVWDWEFFKTSEDAERTAKIKRSKEREGWTYQVLKIGSGWQVAMYDEENEFIAYAMPEK